MTFDRRVARALRHPRIAALTDGETTDPGTHNHNGTYEPAGAVADHAATPHGGDAGPHEHAEYATDADLIASIEAHAAEPHGGEAGPHTHAEYADASHDHAHAHAEYATDTDLSTHAATEHGLSSHALDGAYHSGAEILPTQGQKNALSGTAGTPGDANRYVTDQDARLSDERTPAAHAHDEYATDADLAAHAATPHGGGDTGAHDHDADYAALAHAHADKADAAHAHDTTHSHTAADVGAAESGHTHDTSHSHTLADADIPAGIARDTEVTAAIDAHLAAATHGGGSSTHPDLATHDALGLATDAALAAHGSGAHFTQQPAIANVNRSGNASTQTTNLQNKLDEVIATLRTAGIIAT